MSAEATSEASSGNQWLAILLAMAMFVLVVDTSLMNVSISAVVRDLEIPLLASLLGLFVAFRVTRLPDPEPSAAAEAMLVG
jgi:hypothetical protein